MQTTAFVLAITVFAASPLLSAPNHKLRTEFPQTDGYVRSIAIDPVHDIAYIGGSFSQVGGQGRNNLAAIDTRSGSLLPWNPGTDGSVAKVVLDGDTLFIGGSFNHCGGSTRNRLAAVDRDGSLLPWNPNANNYVLDIVVAPDMVYVSGGFTNVGGFNQTRLANLHKVSGQALLWAPSTNQNPNSLALSGSTFYIGGAFNQMNSVSRSRLGSVTTDGALQPWNPGANDEVEGIVNLGSSLLVHGRFDVIGGVARDGLAMIDAAGNVLPFAPTFDDGIKAVTAQGNRIYGCGYFTKANGHNRRGFAAFDLSGNLLPWSPSYTGDLFYTVQVSKGTVFVGGFIDTVDGVPCKGFAAVYDPALFPVPKISIRGEKRITTSRATIMVKGRSLAASKVEVKSRGKGYQVAKGLKAWSHRVRLKPGANRISARSLNIADAVSKNALQTVVRR